MNTIERLIRASVSQYKANGFVGLYGAVIRKLGIEVLDRFTVDEVSICAKALEIDHQTGVMVDVGAHHGSSARRFCSAGWRVYAFEPDSTNREQLTNNLGGCTTLKIDSRALSNAENDSVEFFTSEQSAGISGLSAFHTSHESAGTVAVTTLSKVITEYGIDEIDFLKIDTEGFDKFVLEGLPWDSHAPAVIVCEYENAKTVPLGYDFAELVRYLTDRGYEVMVSEWKPVVAYGGKHEWLQFKSWPCELASEKSWGNLIASREPAIFERVRAECERIERRLG